MTDRYVPAELRRLVRSRAADCCEYCRSQVKYSPQSFSVEHIAPRQAGGPTVAENLALSCQGCNSHKATRTTASDPVTDTLVPLFNPREQRWLDHFAWSEDYTRVVGLTPSGRATVEALKLNRVGLVNMRRVLHAEGDHPTLE